MTEGVALTHCDTLCSGETEEGVEHLSNAVAVCGQPQQLLQVLQQTLPPQVFALLVQKLPSVGEVFFFSETFVVFLAENHISSS